MSRIKKIKETLGNSSDIVTREINNISYIYLESVSSDDKVSVLMRSISRLNSVDKLFEQLQNNIFNSNLHVLDKLEDCYYYLSSGYTCVFVEKEKSFIAIETKASIDRSVSESNSEPLIRGPKDSFTENNAINLGLVRKRIKDPKLRFDELKIGRRTKSKVTVIYVEDIAKESSVERINQILEGIDIDGILDTGYIRDFLEANNKSVFPKMISTERPDLTCQNLLLGKIVIMVENSPYVLILPAVLTDFLKVSEDYYQSSLNSSFSRILKIISLFVTIITPALYIALMTYNHEMIPNELLISLSVQRSQVPFPTFLEVLIFVIFFEILREADNRAPNISGASMSIVGALILGDAAVRAGLVTPLVIIIVAITSICELVFTDMDFINAIRQWRLIFILSAMFLGIIGILIAALILIIKLASLEVLNSSYLNSNFSDGIILFPANKRLSRPDYITDNKKKVGNI